MNYAPNPGAGYLPRRYVAFNMKLILAISILVFFISCRSDEPRYNLPSIHEMEISESVTILEYSGHIPLSVGERSNLGGAYRFEKKSNTTFKVFSLNPYSTFPEKTVLDSSLVESSFVLPIDSLINYYREFNTDFGGCSAVTNAEFIWHGTSNSLIEKYSDDSCGLSEYFKQSPLMPALWESGLKPKP